MHVAHAEALAGIREIEGPRHHPRIVEYFMTVKGLGQLKLSDETPWCSAFMNWVMSQVGGEMSTSPLARSWMSVGTDVTTSPREGDIAVFFSTLNQINGHVGLYVCHSPDRKRVLILGGNQGNQVCYQWYPVTGQALRLASIRRIGL